ncbi:MAG: acetylglutamate kinase [Christensenellaceae bacterium]|nr:acetylglutamate kinase [Christensenellaceae bacterium]MEA5066822.1 acetylglutamate kinase [Eubacteriales bacterium]MEA5068106.1 acetylglutamate kinase [Christensenellaceae bacterium]
MFPEPVCAEGGLTREQLRVSNLNRRLWSEHVLWTRFFIVSTVFSLPDLPFVTQRLLQNPRDFADELRPLYGEQVAARFGELLTGHLLIAAQLVNAAKAGDAAEVARQRALWYANAEEIARFLAGINPFWSERIWRELLFDHLRMTEDEATQMLTGQYERSIQEFDAIQAEALEMADVMTCGIVEQFCI